jgi:hypothetical protein
VRSPKLLYPAQTIASDPNFPHGKARNVLVEGDGTGTPLEASWLNDLWGAIAWLMQFGGQTPNELEEGVNGSQIGSAIAYLIEHVEDLFGDVVSHTSFKTLGGLRVEGDPLVVKSPNNVIDGTTTVSKPMTFTAQAILQGGLFVQSAVLATFDCVVAFQQNVAVTGQLFASGLTTLNGDVNVQKSLRLNGARFVKRTKLMPDTSGVTIDETDWFNVCIWRAPTITASHSVFLGDASQVGSEIELVNLTSYGQLIVNSVGGAIGTLSPLSGSKPGYVKLIWFDAGSGNAWNIVQSS